MIVLFKCSSSHKKFCYYQLCSTHLRRYFYRNYYFVLAEILGKYSLPDIEPFYLLRSEQFPRLFERPGKQFAQSRAKDFNNKHCLPIGNSEAGAISIQHNNASIHLINRHLVLVMDLLQAIWIFNDTT